MGAVLRKLALLLALGASPSVAGPAPGVRAPTRGWDVNFADAQCLASREYGSPQEPLQLVLKSPAIGGVVQVAIVRKGAAIETAQRTATVAVDDRPPFKASLLSYSPKGSGLRVYTMNLSAAEFAPLRQATKLSVRAGELEENFALSQMSPLMMIVDTCVSDLRRVFNISDPETGTASPLQHRATAKTSLARFISNNDYPGLALESEQGGTVKFALLIGENGRVADCTVVETSGVAVLDAQACAVLKSRAEFEPAIGADGKPTRDAVTTRVVFRIQG
jgi:TonB family protein